MTAPPAPKPADATAKTGVYAVQESKRARAQQDVVRVEKDEQSSAIRTAGGKTFYLREGVWTDAELKARREAAGDGGEIWQRRVFRLC